MASSPWAEAVTSWRELSLIDGCQGLVDGLLHQSVNHGGDAQQALLAIVLRYLYSTDWVRTVWAVLQGTYQRILVSQEPREEFLTRHLVDTAASLVANHRFVGLVQVIGTKDSLQQVLLVEWYFHDVVFTHPHESLRSPIPFGFRPSSLGAAINFCQCFLRSYFHKVCFNYYRLI